ncbi:MAG: PAS domain S-box protein [Planctomycetota bacterium]|jgi:PAS domain S-box-containing protein
MTKKDTPDISASDDHLKLYQDLVETSQDLIFQCGAEGRYTYLNPAWETTFGYTIDEMLGKRFTDFQTPEMAKCDIEEYKRLMRGNMVRGYETVHLGKAGNEIHLVFNAKFILDDQGQIVGTRGTAHDITERKQAEEDLRKREIELKDQLDVEKLTNKVSITIANAVNEKINEAISSSLEDLAKFVGANRSSWFSFSSDMKGITNTHEWCLDPSDSQINLLQNIPFESFGWHHDQLLNKGKSIISRVSDYPSEAKNELEWVKGHGHRSLLFITLYLREKPVGALGFYGPKGEDIDWPAHFIDMLYTVGNVILNAIERSRTEEKLKESEERFELAMNASNDGLFDWNLITNAIYYSPGWKKMIGYEDHELPNDFSVWEETTAPEDVRKSWELQQKLISKQIDRFVIEFKMKHKDGHWVDILSRAKAIFNDKGKAIRIVGTHTDITDQNLAKEELVKAKDNAEESEVFVECNQAALDLLKMTREEFIFQPPVNISPQYQPNGRKSEEAALEMIELAYKNGLHRFDWTCLNSKGEEFIVEVSLMPITVKGETMLHTTWRDVTERSMAEKAIARRVAALTGPGDEGIGSIAFEELFNVGDIQRLQDEFANATGVASIITHVDGVPITEPSNFCQLCSGIIRKTEKGCENCYKSDAVIGSYHPEGPVIQQCLSGGLWDAGAAISVGGKHIANWLIGQVRDETQTEGKMRAYAREIGADEEAFIKAFHEVPSMSRERFGDIAKVLFTLANQLSTLAYQNLQQARFISAQKQAEEAIATEKERLAVTLRSIGDGVITTDTHGNVVLMNNVAEDLTGWKQNEAEGKPLASVFNIIDENTRNPHENPVEKVLSTGQLIELENHTLLISRNGTERVIAESCAPIKDKENMNIGVVLVFRDMTEEQRLLKITQNSQKLESLGVLAGGIAHDFNNLLGGIFGYIEMAMRKSTEADVTQRLSKAMNTIDRAQSLTSQLLTFAKGGAPVQEISSLFPFVQETAQFTLSGSNVSCNFDVPQDLWVCNFDKNQIGQVVDNLIINAQQAMPDGGTIELTARNVTFAEKEHPTLIKGNYIKLSVKDYGIGMPKEIISKIFDPFYTTKIKGHGLGLATCYSIIDRHDGSIDVDSEPGKGTTFNIYLPASMESASSAKKNAGKTHKGSGTILVMDDEEVIREIISDMLEILGYMVVCKENGKDAVGFFASDLKGNQEIVGMIFDLTVPGGMGGKEAVSEIRKLCSDIPVFVASGYAEDPIMKNPVEHGFTASIGKPFKQSELSEMLGEYMKK